MTQMNLPTTETDSHREQTCGFPKGWGRDGLGV